jgi:hypothetical protein
MAEAPFGRGFPEGKIVVEADGDGFRLSADARSSLGARQLAPRRKGMFRTPPPRRMAIGPLLGK